MARTSSIGRRLAALKKQVFHLPLRRRSVLAFGLLVFLGVAVIGALKFAMAESAPVDSVATMDETKAKPAENTSQGVQDTDVKTTTATPIMRVRVLDRQGKPIAGAKLWAKYRGGKLDDVTDAEGKADLALPPPDKGYIYLFAGVDGYVPLRKTWTNQDGREPRPDGFTFTFEERGGLSAA